MRDADPQQIMADISTGRCPLCGGALTRLPNTTGNLIVVQKCPTDGVFTVQRQTRSEPREFWGWYKNEYVLKQRRLDRETAGE
jgi:ssDNA-binding Zn-finger/Zn-ribbon topoisomerase 1